MHCVEFVFYIIASRKCHFITPIYPIFTRMVYKFCFEVSIQSVLNVRMKNMILRTSLITIIIFASSCASTSKVVETKAKRTPISVPELNVTIVSELGDTLVDQGFTSVRKGLRLKSEVKAGYFAWNIILGDGQYVGLLENSTFV